MSPTNIFNMPNWCYNYITITGEPQSIARIADVCQNLQGGLFEALIGTAPDSEADWYWANVDWFGTKWDVGSEFVEDIEKDTIVLSGDTAWSPPTNFCARLAKKYGVEVEMHYEEMGIDLCGQTLIDKQGNCSYQDYGFAEGKYKLEGYVDWYMEWESHLCEYLAEHMKDEGDTDFVGRIKAEYPYLQEEEVTECAVDLTVKFKEIN